MRISLTTAGINAIQQSTDPVVLSSYKIGSATSYVPDTSDIDIHGVELFSGTPSSPYSADPNTVRYIVYLDSSVSISSLGEVGLYLSNGDLFALACMDSTINKTDNTLQFVLYVATDSYDAWINPLDSFNIQIPALHSVSQLSPVRDSTPNTYIINRNNNPVLAVNSSSGLWMFDGYSIVKESQVSTSTTTSIDIPLSDYIDSFDSVYDTKFIVQFTSGNAWSLCRAITDITKNSSSVTLKFDAFFTAPDVNSTIQILQSTAVATINQQAVDSNHNISIPLNGLSTYGYKDLGTVGSVVDIDMTKVSFYKMTLNEDSTRISPSGAVQAGLVNSVTLMINQGIGARLIEWPEGILWSEGVAPILSFEPNSEDMITLVRLSATSYYGMFNGGNFEASS